MLVFLLEHYANPIGLANLFAVETVDSLKKAEALEKARSHLAETSSTPIRRLEIYLQINTSDEPNKAGIRLEKEACLANSELVQLAKFIQQDCTQLVLAGLMTIGSYQASTTSEEYNEDFEKLAKLRDALEAELGGEPLGLSMGMSSDFELAIRMRSDNVRVGSRIFGERPPFKP